jgi:methyltransferase (TIGR00027 family)
MDTEASKTAIGAAMMRAAHLVLDDDPKIFRDDLAMRFSGYETETALRDQLKLNQITASEKLGADAAQRLFQSVRAGVTIRSRVTEDALFEAMKRGITRYVVLGAGLDSFAWRRADLADKLEVYEIDHPASQDWKRARLRDLGIASTPNIHFIPIDFEKQTLLEGMREGRLPLDKPLFFSWLGVTLYLTREIVLDTLRQIATLPSGTEISFTFRVPASQLKAQDEQIAKLVASSAASVNEPFLSAFEPDELAARVRELGFSHVTHVGPKETNATYFAGRSDGLEGHTLSHIMLARV